MEKCTVYVGSFIAKGGKGIMSFLGDVDTGKLELLCETPQNNPSYVILNQAGTRLYCVMETREHNGVPGGAVGAYEVLANGELKLLNEQSTQANGPTHLSLAVGERHLFAANYGGGSCTCFPINPDGSLAPASAVIQHEGSGPHPNRQKKPFAHYVTPSPDGLWACVVDLGTDSVMLHPYSPENGLSGEGSVRVPLAPGVGPRHMVFSHDGRYAYVVGELISQVDVFEYLGKEGMRHLQSVSTLPEGFEGENFPGAIRLSHDGKTIYVTNRRHDTVGVLTVGADHLLTFKQEVPTGGKNPRDINLMPGGKFLLCGNQDEVGITVLRVLPDGGLEPTGISCDVSMPVCFAFGKA